jgi:hypothetical protein
MLQQWKNKMKWFPRDKHKSWANSLLNLIAYTFI